ncbi:MAG: hypothetical protein ABI158_03845 [Edaphobacter sp.]
MKSLQRSQLLPFLIVFIGSLGAIVVAFIAGKITPLEMGYAFATACFTAIVVLTLLLSQASSEGHAASELEKDSVSPVARKKILRNVRNYQIVIAVMPVLFAYALWSTMGDPLLPRIIGAAINVTITSAFIVALKTQKAKLKE